MSTLKLLDLFSGIGGFSYAAERIVGGFETIHFVECDLFCQKVLNQHWPHVPIHPDVSKFPFAACNADVITAGFPCQDISAAGKQLGIKLGKRSGLFSEVLRAVREIRPSFIVLENVSAIKSAKPDRESDHAYVVGQLAELGYDTEWDCIRASSLGAPHHRNRWWLVAYPNSSGIQRLWPQRQLPEASRQVSTYWSSSGGTSPEGWSTRRCQTESPLLRVDDGLPDWVDRVKSLGNTVVPQVAAIPLERVLQLHRLYSP